MKVYVLNADGYEADGAVFGAFTTLEQAKAAQPKIPFLHTHIVEVYLDVVVEEIYRSGVTGLREWPEAK
jgi:hypothetical protein